MSGTEGLLAQANQNAVTISAGIADNEYVITITDPATDPIEGIDPEEDGLYAFASSDPGQIGDAEWVAVAIATNKTITDLTWQGATPSQADIDEATVSGFPGGKTFIWWIRYDEISTGISRTISDGDTSITVTVKK